MSHTKAAKVMKEFKAGRLHSGSKTGPKVKSRKQAVAIALSEERKAGQKAMGNKPKKAFNAGGFERARRAYFGLGKKGQ